MGGALRFESICDMTGFAQGKKLNATATVERNGVLKPSLVSPRGAPLVLPNCDIPSDLVVEKSYSTLPNGDQVSFIKVRDAVVVGAETSVVFLQAGERGIWAADSSLLPSIAHLTIVPEAIDSPSFNPQSEERLIEGPLLFLAGEGARWPYHWHYDGLTRLLAFERMGLPQRVLVPSFQSKSKFVHESLELLGVPKEGITYVNPHERLRVRELWIAEDLAPQNSKMVSLLATLRTRMLEAAGCDPERVLGQGQGKKIYISRQGSPTRRALENGELFSKLAGVHGFLEQRLEALPLKDQIRLLAETTDLLAPHGAGLFQSLYMPGGDIVELFPVDEFGGYCNRSCWERILDVHAADGRQVTWSALKSEIVRKDSSDKDMFSIVADVPGVDAYLRDPVRPTANVWSIFG